MINFEIHLVPGGLSLREGMQIVEAAADTKCLTAFDMVEVNPELGTKSEASLTAGAAKHVLFAALSKHRGT